MIAMLDELERRHLISGPVGVLGDSYGAALALRWATRDTRIRTVVAMAPYDRLGDAMEGLRKTYCPWVPRSWVRQAAEKLPRLVGVGPDGLNTTSAIGDRAFPAFLISGESDPVASQPGIEALARKLGPETQVQRLPRSGHEEIPYEFDALNTPVRDWFDRHLR
jgi:pimeloyl-ACP methyl ester carboxylesterase